LSRKHSRQRSPPKRTNVKQRKRLEIHKVEEYFLEYLTGNQDEDWAIEYIADAPFRGQELREILNTVYAGMKRTDQLEERARSIRRRLDQNGL